MSGKPRCSQQMARVHKGVVSYTPCHHPGKYVANDGARYCGKHKFPGMRTEADAKLVRMATLLREALAVIGDGDDRETRDLAARITAELETK